MTKRAAAMKAVASKKQEEVPVEEIFDIMREGFITILETNVITAKRVDNLLNIRDAAKRFWGDVDNHYSSIQYYKELQKLSVKTYEDILAIIKDKYTIENLSNIEIDDWFDEIIPNVEKIESEKDLMEAMIIFLSVKPYAEKVLRDHNNFQEELEKRKAKEK